MAARLIQTYCYCNTSTENLSLKFLTKPRKIVTHTKKVNAPSTHHESNHQKNVVGNLSRSQHKEEFAETESLPESPLISNSSNQLSTQVSGNKKSFTGFSPDQNLNLSQEVSEGYGQNWDLLVVSSYSMPITSH